MPVRDPAPHDPNALRRDLDPRARGLLRGDIPNYWAENVHALSNLSASQVLYPSTFDGLTEVNKRIVIARVRHLIDVMQRRYIRHEQPYTTHMPWHGGKPVVFYVGTEDIWQRILYLLAHPGPGGRDLSDYLYAAGSNGDVVDGNDLEECLARGKSYSEPLKVARHRKPILEVDRLDSDDVHAFLCAYDTCFHPRTREFFPFLKRLLQGGRRKMTGGPG